MNQVKKSRPGLKRLMYLGLIVGSLYAGDKLQPYTAIKENSFFHNASVEDGFYQSPRTLEISFVKNDKNRVEVYLSDKVTGDSLRIRENMHVGTVGQSIDDEVNDFKDNFQNWWDRTSNKATNYFQDLKKNF